MGNDFKVRFNPKLVRLEESEVIFESAVERRFNPKLVRLEVTERYHLRDWTAGFNPKLVRLEGFLKATLTWMSCTFQSQTGSIRSQSPLRPR